MQPLPPTPGASQRLTPTSDPWALLRELSRQGSSPDSPFRVEIVVKVPQAPSERSPVEAQFAAAVRLVALEFVRNRFRAMRVAELTEKLSPLVPEHLIRTVLELHRRGFEPRKKGWFKPVAPVVEELAM